LQKIKNNSNNHFDNVMITELFLSKLLRCIIAAFLICAGCISGANALAETKKLSTAQSNVVVLNQTLTIPSLQRQRQLRLYLPPDYETSTQRYPVLYMHDGQNLFDAATGYAGEWHVDETLNRLSKSGKLDLIVVGIDNGGEQRLTELNPWTNARFGAGGGGAYMDFIVHVVKPYIDQQYRTKADRQHTAIMGSSLGGLISHYAIAQYPEVFSKAGIFSPSYWIADQSFSYFAGTPSIKDARLYLLMGGKEGGSQLPDVKRVYASLLAAGHPAQGIKLVIDPKGKHNEAFWSKEFETAILWLFAPDGEQIERQGIAH
jgi:predicted alpha/beta superfamily hydrolase